MKNAVRLFVPEYGKIHKEKYFSNQTNSWIFSSLIEAKTREKNDKNNKNQVFSYQFSSFFIVLKDFMSLFRLLGVKYRAKYPLQGKTIEIDQDLKVYMENKICSAFLK